MDVVKSLELMFDHMVGGGLTSFLFYLKKEIGLLQMLAQVNALISIATIALTAHER